MGNRFSHLLFMCAMGLLIGCYNPQRDLSIDPYNTPLIHILDASYNVEENTWGVVTVQWEYLGQKRVENFVLQRRDISDFRNIELSSGADDNGKYATVGAFRDEKLIAGERLQYRVVAEHSEGGLVSTSAVEVPIPGAGLREIRRDPVALAVQLVWHDEGNTARSYEILRTPEGGDKKILAVIQSRAQTSFWDRSISDNRSYTYAIRSMRVSRSPLSTDVRLTSRSVSVQFYREVGRHIVEALSGTNERMRLAAADSDGEADMLALIVRPNQISLSRLRHTLSVDIPNALSRHLVGTSFPRLNDLVSQSVDLAGPSLAGQGAFQRAYIGGLDRSGRVVVVGIELINNNTVWRIPDNWVSASSHVRLAQDDQQRIYIATGGQLRVYSAAGSPVGTFDLEEDPVDIAVHNGVIWAAWANRVQRGVLRFSGEVLNNIAWEVVLHTQIEPRALTLNAAGQIFVLDRRQVRVFQTDGTPLLLWALPSSAFSAGDLTIGGSARNFVHLSDESGGVITYVP